MIAPIAPDFDRTQVGAVIGLDLASRTGVAKLTPDGARVLECGFVDKEEAEHLYPLGPLKIAEAHGRAIALRVEALAGGDFTAIVVEETNRGKNRYSQKYLEFLHSAVLRSLDRLPTTFLVAYVDTSEWRRVLDIRVSAADKKLNARLARGRRAGVSKKALGIKGKVTTKHVAVRFVNETYGLTLIQKDNDAADAVCEALAWIRGAEACDGT